MSIEFEAWRLVGQGSVPGCGTVARRHSVKEHFSRSQRECTEIRLARAPPNRKRPTGEAGRFWGYYREERYVSLYMWIRGR